MIQAHRPRPGRFREGNDEQGSRVRQVGIRRAFVALAALLAASAAAAVPASAAVLVPAQGCFVNSDPADPGQVKLLGGGFAPGHQISLRGSGVSASGIANGSGGVTFVTAAPLLDTSGPATRTLTLSADDASVGGETLATATVRVANLAFVTQPRVAKLSARVRWSFSGFPSGHELYAHFTRRGKQIGEIRFGRTTGPCGTLSVRAKFFPLGRVPAATYGLQVDDSSRYSGRTRPSITTSISTFF